MAEEVERGSEAGQTAHEAAAVEGGAIFVEEEKPTHDYMSHAEIDSTSQPIIDESMGSYMDCRRVNLELSQWNLKDIIIDYKALGTALRPFVLSGSKVHRLTPEDLNVYANTTGIYDNKETKQVIMIGKLEVPTTMMGLMANGTKFFDAWVWLSMNPNLRPLPIELPIKGKPEDKIELSTSDDVSVVTSYLFIAYFFILIRAHPPSQLDAYVKQPMPKFISTIMGSHATAVDVATFLASFELTKISNEWVTQIPPPTLNVKAAYKLGLGIAGYRLVSVFNVLMPTKYYSDDAKKNEELAKTRPPWLETSLEVMRSFKSAGPCWNFHPATRDPNLISKYGNLNKNAANMIIDCYDDATITDLVKKKKLAAKPTRQYGHTEYKTWTIDMKYVATRKIFN